ncbi:MAG: glycosyltransferase family 1 protein [Elusimicrobiota bacterium]|nr:glycosyltransferase family 4 protein [Endomicrobiia bacterium]MDW8165361.1 glycosyltransferase family 1 protein [Elusimicrobiota bacterium]
MYSVKKFKIIGIDATPIIANYFQGAGISKYISNIINLLLEIDTKNEYYFFIRTFRKTIPKQVILDYEKYANVKFKKVFLPDRVQKFIWDTKILTDVLQKQFYNNLDIFFSTVYFTPYLKNVNVISFIYDITPIRSPVVSPSYRESFRELLFSTIQRSDYFIVISEFTKKDVIAAFNLPEEKIEVVYPVISERFCIQPKEIIFYTLKKYGLNPEEKYILYVGVRGENKNLLTAVKAFSYLVNNYKIKHNFVFVGRPDCTGKVDKDIMNFALNNNIIDRIKFISYLPDDDLPAIYSGADLFVFPSLYEGFGMPLVEAMSCGVPIVASNTSSIPEVVADAGILCSPYDYISIAEAMYLLIVDENIRQNIIKKGLERSKKFKDTQIIKKLLNLINK